MSEEKEKDGKYEEKNIKYSKRKINKKKKSNLLADKYVCVCVWEREKTEI